MVWTAALICLACYNPATEPHLALCPLYNLGITFCPGCGLGRSIAYFFHGQFRLSLTTHPLGIFAVIILSFRIIQQTKNYYRTLWHA